jgi:hypothetical protein
MYTLYRKNCQRLAQVMARPYMAQDPIHTLHLEHRAAIVNVPAAYSGSAMFENLSGGSLRRCLTTRVAMNCSSLSKEILVALQYLNITHNTS